MNKILLILLIVLLGVLGYAGFFLYPEYKNMHQTLRENEKKLADLNRKNAELTEVHSQLQLQIQECSERFKTLEEERGQVLRESEQKISELNKKNSLLIEERANLQGQIQKCTENLGESEKKLADLSRKNAELTEAHSQLQSQIQGCTETLKILEEKRDQILRESEQTIPKLNKKIFLLTEERGNLQGQIQKCTENLRDLEKTLAALRDETEFTKSQIDQVKSTYEALSFDLKEQIQKQQVTIKEFQKELSVSFVDRILFDFGKATLTMEGEMILKKVGEVLKKIKEKRIRIIGHTDNIPIHPDYQYKYPTNWELSAARAASVVRYFQEYISLGAKDMEAVGRSFYQPIASNETEEGRALNRRVEIIIAPRMEVQKK